MSHYNSIDADDDDVSALTPSNHLKTSPTDFVEWGPPPDMKQRQLIFDSLNKIVTAPPQKNVGHSKSSNAGRGDSRGTYIFTWGAGYMGQLGRKFVRGQKKYSAIPMQVEMNVVIRQVTCGGLHTAVVTENGQIYTWGDGRRGELGHVHDPSLKQTPRLVEMLDHVFIISVACGGSHTVATADNGSLYSFGYAKYGQLGHGDRTNQKFPKKIEHPYVRDIISVACGNKHTICITRHGTALAFGCNKHGQLGLGDFEDRLEPCKIHTLKEDNHNMNTVACGAIHSCLVSNNGDVYLCGFGESMFQHSEQQHFFPIPQKVELPEPAKSIACGQSHNLCLSISGNVYAWGACEYGQIGYGIKGNSATPRLVLDTRNVAQIAAGRYHSFALTNSGILYSWGCGENGQLGLNSDENIVLPTVVTPILGTVVGQVACGEHHTAILTSAPWTKLSPDVHEWLHAAKVEHELKEQYLKKTHRGLTIKDLQKLQDEMKKWRCINDKHKEELALEEKEETKKDLQSIHFVDTLLPEIHKQFQEYDARQQQSQSQQQQSSSSQQQQSQHHHQQYNNRIDDDDDNNEQKQQQQQQQGGGLKLPHLNIGKAQKQQLQQQQQGNYAQTERIQHSRSAGILGNNNNNNNSNDGTQVAIASANANADGSQTVRMDRTLELTQRAHTANNNNNNNNHTQPLLPTPLTSARTQFLKETAQMIKRMTAVIHDKGEVQSQKELSEALQQVYSYRKEYDHLKCISRNLQKQAQDIKKELELLQLTNQANHSSSSSSSSSSPTNNTNNNNTNTTNPTHHHYSDNREQYENRLQQ